MRVYNRLAKIGAWSFWLVLALKSGPSTMTIYGPYGFYSYERYPGFRNYHFRTPWFLFALERTPDGPHPADHLARS